MSKLYDKLLDKSKDLTDLQLVEVIEFIEKIKNKKNTSLIPTHLNN